MKEFFRTKIGKRLLWVPLILASAVALGFLLRDFVGPQSEQWQRSIFCIAAFGTGLGALFFTLLGPWGLSVGYGLTLLKELPDLLPEPWNRYYAVAYFGLLLLIPVLLKQWKTRRSEGNKKPGHTKKDGETTEQSDAPAEEEDDGGFGLALSGDTLVVRLPISDRYYQLIRTAGELRAYRIGGVRGVDEKLIQDTKKPLRPLGKKDLVFPLDETFGITMRTKYDNRLDREVLDVKLRSGRSTYRMEGLAKNRQIRAFFSKCTSNCAEKKEQSATEGTPDVKRVVVLRKVNIALGAATVLIDLPWLFLNVPYRLFSMLALLPLPVVLALCCIFPDDTTVSDNARAERTRASFTAVLLGAALVPALRTMLDFNFLNWERLLLISAAVFAVLFGAVMFLTSEWRTRKSAAVAVIFALLCYSFGFTAQVNHIFNDNAPTQCEAVVEEAHIYRSSKRPDTYKLTVRLPDGQTQKLSVGERFYEQTEVGDTVTVTTFIGALGIAYAAAD